VAAGASNLAMSDVTGGLKAAYLFHVDDAPLQGKLGMYEEFPNG